MTRVLVTRPGCGGCDQARDRLAELGKDAEFREVSVTNQIGEQLAEDLDLRLFPACVEIEDGQARECDIYEVLEYEAPGDGDTVRFSEADLQRLHKELSALGAE